MCVAQYSRGGGVVVEPKENQRKPAPKKKTKRGGRRPGAGAPRGNMNALKHGRFSHYQQAFIEALKQVPETREIMIAISSHQRARTTKRPNTKRPTTYASAKRENSPKTKFFRTRPNPAPQNPRINQTRSTRHSALGAQPPSSWLLTPSSLLVPVL